MTRPRPIVALLLLVASLGAAGTLFAAGGAAADSNTVYARLFPSGRHLRLTITLNGSVVRDGKVTSRACGSGCQAASIAPGKSALRVVALRRDGVPDVIVGLFSGGAHCCYVDQVYRLDPGTNRFAAIEHNFLDAGARIVDLKGNRDYEFFSADARVSNTGFTDYAHSPAPIQIWSVNGGRFRDITGRYPARVAKDAARWLRAFRRQHGNGRGMIAAWAADELRLGHAALIKSELAGALRAGRLGVPRGLGGPTPAAFAEQLPKALRRLGY